MGSMKRSDTTMFLLSVQENWSHICKHSWFRIRCLVLLTTQRVCRLPTSVVHRFRSIINWWVELFWASFSITGLLISTGCGDRSTSSKYGSLNEFNDKSDVSCQSRRSERSVIDVTMYERKRDTRERRAHRLRSVFGRPFNYCFFNN